MSGDQSYSHDHVALSHTFLEKPPEIVISKTKSRQLSGLDYFSGTYFSGTESAGINRHIVGDERALRKRRSDSILASSLACDLARERSEA